MKKITIGLLLILFHFIGYSQSNTIDIATERNRDKGYNFNFKKSKLGTYTVILSFSKLENATVIGYGGVYENRKFVTTIDRDRGVMLHLKPNNPKKTIEFSYKKSWYRGDINAMVDKEFVYTFPFKKGVSIDVRESRNVSEEYLGSEKPGNWTSYAFGTKDVDTIVATRKGVIIEIIEDNEVDTLSKYTSKSNKILIEHQDGTFGSYKGFKRNGVIVRKGQIVYPQTVLGVLETKKGTDQSFMNFSVFYLSDISRKKDAENGLKNKKSRVSYVKPYFLTKDGTKLLENKNNYTVGFPFLGHL